MNVFQWLGQWIHIVALYFIIEGILIAKRKKIPFRVQSLEVSEQNMWRKWRVLGNFSWGIGIYIHHTVENITVSHVMFLIIFSLGTILSFLGLFSIIRNNIKHLNSWTSTI